jgi:hypothetical protein
MDVTPKPLNKVPRIESLHISLLLPHFRIFLNYPPVIQAITLIVTMANGHYESLWPRIMTNNGTRGLATSCECVLLLPPAPMDKLTILKRLLKGCHSSSVPTYAYKNAGVTEREYSDADGRGKGSRSKEIWRWSVHRTSFYCLNTVTWQLLDNVSLHI